MPDPVQVRLLGIDAPETHGADGLPQCWAEAAKAQLLRLAPRMAVRRAGAVLFRPRAQESR